MAIKINEFEYSLKGLFNILSKRKLYKKKWYIISIIVPLGINIIFFLIKDRIFNRIEYLDILQFFIDTFLQAFISFCGFAMTAYSLVVGFLNYGVFKSSIEKWYRIREENNGESAKYSLYQNGIALFALAILTLLFSVLFLLIVKFIIKLNIIVECELVDLFNAIILCIATILISFCINLIFHNIINIFTFGQLLHQMIYHETKVSNKKNNN